MKLPKLGFAPKLVLVLIGLVNAIGFLLILFAFFQKFG
jgi:hypothetical protein